jgi:hypothetical protein
MSGVKHDSIELESLLTMNGGGTLSPANGDLTVAATSDDLLLNAQDDVFIQTGMGSSTKTVTFQDDGNTVFSGGIYLPQGAHDYNTNIPNFSQSGVSSYSASTNTSYTENTMNTPGKGEKAVCQVAARAYTNYVHLKTNLTSNNIMFYFRTRGYCYNFGMEEHVFGGYTYNDTIIAMEHITVFGGTHTLAAYRGSSGHLVLRIHVNQTGYTEGKLHVLFGSHSDVITRNLEITDVTQRDDGNNAF